MESPSPQSGAMHETCLGFDLTDERSITDKERANLQVEEKQSLKRTYAWGCGAPLAFYLGLDIIFLVIVYLKPPLMKNPALVLAISITLLTAIAYFAFRAKGQYKLRKAAKQDLSNGRIKLYQGVAPAFQENEAAAPDAEAAANQKKDRRPQLFGVAISPAQPITLEVFSASRRLRQVNGMPVEKLILLPEERTAPQPQQARTVAKWVEPARIISGNTLDISQSGRRQLSEDEKSELTQRAQTAWRRPAVAAFFFTTYLIGLLWMDRVAPANTNPGAAEYFFIGATIWMDVIFFKTMWRSWRLMDDVKNGEVIVTREPDQMNEGEIIKKGNVVEWLALSKQGWSINGQPAAWRLRR